MNNSDLVPIQCPPLKGMNAISYLGYCNILNDVIDSGAIPEGQIERSKKFSF